MRIRAFNYETSGPGDVSAIRRALEHGEYRAEDVLCIIGKTEGNGGRNDFTRELAMSSLEHLFAPRLGIAPEHVQDRVVFSFSGGTEGVVTPHMIVFVREGKPASTPGPHKRLAMAIGHTREFLPEEIGFMPQIEETARLVRSLAEQLQLETLQDVHLVQMKGAIPPFDHSKAEAGFPFKVPKRNDMVHSRAASALGVALALSEVKPERIRDEIVCYDWSLYSGVASCSAKPGLRRTEAVLFANSALWDGDLIIGHGVLDDILDVAGIQRVTGRVGLGSTLPLPKEQSSKLVGVFAKSEAAPGGYVRGRRHTMLNDDDISDTRYSRCVLSSVLASMLNETRVYVSTRAEHHGPNGGGPLAIIAKAT